MMRPGLQSTRCSCLSKANLYFDGKKAYCPVCGKEHIVEWFLDQPQGVMPSCCKII